jgi:hypothetical protein
VQKVELGLCCEGVEMVMPSYLLSMPVCHIGEKPEQECCCGSASN